MKNATCDVCGKHHNAKDCSLLRYKNESKIQCDSSWALQTLPNWIRYNHKRNGIITLKEIEKSAQLGPVLGPQSTSLRKDSKFPLFIQFSEIKLWLDLTCENRSNWLSLIPSSPQDFNLIACQIGENIFYIAERNIKPTEELRVWYSPHYEAKIPEEVLSNIQNAHSLRPKKSYKENICKIGEVDSLMSSEKVADSDKSEDNLIKKLYRKTGHEALLSLSSTSSHDSNKAFGANNSLQLFYEPPILDNIYISSTSTSTVGLDLLSFQTASSNRSHFSTVSLAPLTIVASNPTSCSNSTHHTSFFVPTQFQNFATSSLIDTNSQVLPYIIQKGDKNMLQNFSSSINVVETENKDKNDNLQTNKLPEVNSKKICNYLTNEDKMNHSERPVFSSSLQKICIKNKEVIFIHKYPCKKINKIHDVNSRKNSKDKVEDTLNKGQIKKISVITQGHKLSKQNRQYFCKENVEKLIEIQQVNFDCPSDIISLNISENQCDVNGTPLCTVTKTVKRESTSAPILRKEHSREEQYQHNESKSVVPNNWICEQCGKAFSNLFSFMQHLKNHLLAHLGRRFKCEICNMMFKNFDNLKVHLITHNAEDPGGKGKSCNQNQTVMMNTMKNHHKNVDENKVKNLWKGSFRCQICLKTYNSAKYLLRHFSKHNGEFYCNLCKKEFSRSQNLKKHICTHRPENALKCNLCKKTFSSSRLLKYHSIEHNEKVKCSSCSRIFLSEKYLKIHETVCAKETTKSSDLNSKGLVSVETSRFSCHICNRNFSSAVYLQDHVSFCKQLDEVNKNGEVVCDRCGAICGGPTELKIHHQTHTFPFFCRNCSQRFRSRGTFDCHICGIDFTCDLCDMKSRSLQEFFKHITCHGYPPFYCSRCRFPYYKIDNIRSHQCKLEVYECADKPVKNKVCCPFCPSLFVTVHNLKKHMASLHCVPLKQKFFCGKCGRGFHRSDLLKSHEKVHLSPSYGCSKCPKKFKSQKAFDLHSVSHNGDFRFVCRFCSKGFTQKKYLIGHEKSHTTTTGSKLNLSKCPSCSSAFVSVQNLRSHLKLCSNNFEKKFENRHKSNTT